MRSSRENRFRSRSCLQRPSNRPPGIRQPPRPCFTRRPITHLQSVPCAPGKHGLDGRPPRPTRFRAQALRLHLPASNADLRSRAIPISWHRRASPHGDEDIAAPDPFQAGAVSGCAPLPRNSGMPLAVSTTRRKPHPFFRCGSVPFQCSRRPACRPRHRRVARGCPDTARSPHRGRPSRRLHRRSGARCGAKPRPLGAPPCPRPLDRRADGGAALTGPSADVQKLTLPERDLITR